ncbi:MAG: GNAT family N-acetyltransferase [Flavobacteriia bacterium]|nr:GNAT family N-acetyltransferase [Flavobacteriia bacterium]
MSLTVSRFVLGEDESEWNAFVDNAKNSTFLFNRSFMDYHKDRFDDYSLIIREGDAIVGCLPANQITESKIASHQGLTYGGLIVSQDARLLSVMEIFRSMLEYLANNGVEVLEYKSFPRFYNSLSTDEVDYTLFRLNAELYRRDTAIAVRQGYQLPYQNRRKRAIKKAIKAGVVIEETDQLDEFYNEVLSPVLQARHGVDPVHSLKELKKLKTAFPNQIRQFNALIEGKVVAGTTVFESNQVAHAQYIAVVDEGMKLGANDYLFSYLIENTFRDKDFFDFGICNEDAGRTLNKGLLEWKEGFGARSYAHDFYRIETASYPNL